MGLENGFRLRGCPPKDIPSFIQLPTDLDNEDEIEIVYWRKCCGIRREIKAVLHFPDDESEMKVDAEDIPAILRRLRLYLREDYYEDNADSIWTYEEILENNLQFYINLLWAKSYLEEHPYASLYFYDSY